MVKSRFDAVDVGIIGQMIGKAGITVRCTDSMPEVEIASGLAAGLISLLSDRSVYKNAIAHALDHARALGVRQWADAWRRIYELDRFTQTGSDEDLMKFASTTACRPPAM